MHGEQSLKVLERLNTTAVGTNDEPINSMRVSDCGQTDSDVRPYSSSEPSLYLLPLFHQGR